MNARLAPQVTPAADLSDGHQWFVSSGSQDGVWYRVSYQAGHLECSCMAGRMAVVRQGLGAVARSCKHLIAVLAFEQSAAASTSAIAPPTGGSAAAGGGAFGAVGPAALPASLGRAAPNPETDNRPVATNDEPAYRPNVLGQKAG